MSRSVVRPSSTAEIGAQSSGHVHVLDASPDRLVPDVQSRRNSCRQQGKSGEGASRGQVEQVRSVYDRRLERLTSR
jgi:hypothetical protein